MCVSDSDTGLELQGRVRVREISGMEGEREREGGIVRVRGDIGTYGFPPLYVQYSENQFNSN